MRFPSDLGYGPDAPSRSLTTTEVVTWDLRRTQTAVAAVPQPSLPPASAPSCQPRPGERAYGQPDLNTINHNGAGGPPPSADNLSGPVAVALDHAGNLYVAEPGRDRVVSFQAGSTTASRVYGQPDFTSGGPVSAESTSSLKDPLALALDSADNLYVADGHRLVEFAAGHTTVTRTLALPGPSDRSQATTATGHAFDDTGALYVADPANARIIIYAAGSNQPTGVVLRGGRCHGEPRVWPTGHDQPQQGLCIGPGVWVSGPQPHESVQTIRSGA